MAATETVYLRVPPGLKREIERHAVEDGLSVNEWVVHYLSAMLTVLSSRLGVYEEGGV